MPTHNFNLPLINGASPISIVSDMNALATATDSAMGTLATQGDISAISTQVTNANKVATEAQAEAVKATGAADAASEEAAKANANANAAKGSATNANNAVTALKTRVDSVEAHDYFTPLTPHASNPWPVNAWRGKKSNDNTRIEINGFVGIRPSGGGNYAKNSDVASARVTIPGTSQSGIPLFIVGTTLANAITINSGLFWHVADASTPFTYNSANTADIIVGTDGVAYINDQNQLNASTGITYGFANSGTWSLL